MHWAESDASFPSEWFREPGLCVKFGLKQEPAKGLTCWEGGGEALEAGPLGGGPAVSGAFRL